MQAGIPSASPALRVSVPFWAEMAGLHTTLSVSHWPRAALGRVYTWVRLVPAAGELSKWGDSWGLPTGATNPLFKGGLGGASPRPSPVLSSSSLLSVCLGSSSFRMSATTFLGRT